MSSLPLRACSQEVMRSCSYFAGNSISPTATKNTLPLLTMTLRRSESCIESIHFYFLRLCRDIKSNTLQTDRLPLFHFLHYILTSKTEDSFTTSDSSFPVKNTAPAYDGVPLLFHSSVMQKSKAFCFNKSIRNSSTL